MEGQLLEKDEMREIVAEFITESNELMENAIQDMVAIEGNPDEEVINSIFRAVHTIKGTSSFLGFGTLSGLAHKAEDVLGMIRKGEMAPDKEVTDVLLGSFDLMKQLLDDIKEKGVEDRDAGAVVEGLEALTNTDRKKIGEILVQEEVIKVDELMDALQDQKTVEQGKLLGEIIVDEKLTTEGQMKGFLSKQKTQKEDQTIRIDVRKLDELMNLVGELVLGKNRLILTESMIRKDLVSTGIADSVTDVTNYIEAITNELQLSVMKARLVPISKLFNKMPRLVRDLCRDSGKEIDLHIEGEDTELDRSLIETLHDPLIHIIRNSIDHGVELPDTRVSKGKSPKGLLSMKAYNEGNHIVIEIFDDGNGINLQAVKDKVKREGAYHGVRTEHHVPQGRDEPHIHTRIEHREEGEQRLGPRRGHGRGEDEHREDERPGICRFGRGQVDEASHKAPPHPRHHAGVDRQGEGRSLRGPAQLRHRVS